MMNKSSLMSRASELDGSLCELKNAPSRHSTSPQYFGIRAAGSLVVLWNVRVQGGRPGGTWRPGRDG